MIFGQAYSDVLNLQARKALKEACDWLIDHCFREYHTIKKPQDVDDTVLGSFLPQRYLYKYTPLFFKQFTVCIITVAWKLTQPEHKPLSSVAEELAAWIIIEQAKGLTAEKKSGVAIEKSLDRFLDTYFEDLDFQFLYDDAFDGIDKDESMKDLDITPLTFDDWFKPFSDEPDRTAHPYVV